MRLGLFEMITGQFADGQPVGNLSFEEQRVQSIMDHVARLLNARRGVLPHLTDYGLPDIQEVYQHMPTSVAGLANAVKVLVEKYEPRLRRVQVVEQPSDGKDFKVTFMISGEIVGGSSVRFFTMFSPAGNARVGDQLGGSA